MLHIFLSNRPDEVRYGTTGWPVPGYEIELRGDDGSRCRDGEPGDLLHSRAVGGADVLGQLAPRRARPSRAAGRKAATNTSATPTATYTYAGRSDDMLKVGGI